MMPPAGALRLRDGRGHRLRPQVRRGVRGSSHPVTVVPGRAEQTRLRGVKVVRTVARSTLTPLNHACSTVCGTTVTGWELGRVVG